jgi:plastocyanin
MKWLMILILLPTLALAGETCPQVGGQCKEACAPDEAAEKGEFLDCTDKQQCCVPKEVPKTSSVVVLIDQFAFSPDMIKIKAGAEVLWKNKDSTDHTVAAEDGSFNSRTITGGGEFKMRFIRPGTYSYTCDMHSFMSGKIVVE